MKKLLIVLASAFLFPFAVFSVDPPQAVKNSFTQKFPGASKVKWSRENTHEFEASFEWSGSKYSSNFSDKGVWLETETETTFDHIPVAVQHAFSKMHKNAKLQHVSRIENSKGETKFEIEIKQGGKTIEFFYQPNGNELIK